MKPRDRTTSVRAHTPPPEPDGIALARALETACYLARERQVSRIRIWSGAGTNVRQVLAPVIAADLLETLIREGAMASDGIQFELQSGEQLEAPEGAVVLAICVDYSEFSAFLIANPVGATI